MSPAPARRLTTDLWYSSPSPSVSVASVSTAGRSAGLAPLLQFRRGAMNGRRVHVDLVLLDGSRAVDVSFHPAATVDLVRSHARRRDGDPNGWLAALLRAVVDDARRWGCWAPAGSSAGTSFADSLLVLGGVSHPLLGAGYDVGVAPVREVPRWASPALAESSVATAAVRLFGVRCAGRGVVRALAAFLVRPVVAWWQLAAAAAMADVVEADDVSAVLSAVGAGAAVILPSSEDVAVLREGFRLLERGRARRVAVDAVTTGGEVGVVRLLRALRSLVEVADDVRWPPPVRLAELEQACLRASAIDPSPAAARAVVGPAPTAVAGPVLPRWTVPRRPPPTTSAATPTGTEVAFDHDRDAAVRFDRTTVPTDGDLELHLPRTPAELAAWGRLLGNCLGDFAPAVAERRSVIVGVRERGTLVAALELRPDLRTVVQFLGPRNRVPPARITTPVLQLVARGSPTAPR